jgi:hypothetical protein
VLRIGQGTNNVCLAPLEDMDSSLACCAALVETDDPDEFFMLEYRKRPAPGWGSGWAENADGILITHILLTGSNAVGPLPLKRIESADGVVPYDERPSETDFWNGRIKSGTEFHTTRRLSFPPPRLHVKLYK